MRLLSFTRRAYDLLLRGYPAGFRRQFGGEMALVFASLSRDAYAERGAAGLFWLWLAAAADGLRAAASQWFLFLFRRKVEIMDTTALNRKDSIQPLKGWEIALAVMPFLLYGVLRIWDGVNDMLVLFSLAMLIGLAAGVLAGFPRWAYVYLGLALINAWVWTDLTINGEPTTWYGWPPLLAVLLVTLAVRRFAPLKKLVTGLWQDWTWPALAIFIFFGWASLLYDEVHHPLLWLFILLTALSLALGAWGYFASPAPLRRVLALMAGLLGATLLSSLAYVAADPRNFSGMDVVTYLKIFAFLGLPMLAFGLLANWLRNKAHAKLRKA